MNWKMGSLKRYQANRKRASRRALSRYVGRGRSAYCVDQRPDTHLRPHLRYRPGLTGDAAHYPVGEQYNLIYQRVLALTHQINEFERLIDSVIVAGHQARRAESR